MMFKKVALFIFAVTALFSSPEPVLKTRLQKAESGDYIVIEGGKMFTLLAIRSQNSRSLILEEISAPSHNLKSLPPSWPEWVKKGAPGHSSWSMVEIDLETKEVLECYSFSRATWIQLSSQESLFATLASLPLKKVEKEDRKKIGPPPLEKEADYRKVWQPPLVFEGKKRETPLFDAFTAHWPQDGSELAGKSVLLYFDTAVHIPLPFWIQVDTPHASVSFRGVDSGKKLPSIYRSMPRRIPQFLNAPQKTKEGLKLSLKSPKYFRSFELFAIDITNSEKEILPISPFTKTHEGELLTIEIKEELLKESLKSKHRYRWLLIPDGYPGIYAESLVDFNPVFD